MIPRASRCSRTDASSAKKIGRVTNLEQEVARHQLTGTFGMGHTRWATHGGVTDANAHPHVSSDGKIALIHNGVIENYAQIKKFLLAKNYTFTSETDTEVLCNLIAYHYAKEPAGGTTATAVSSKASANRFVTPKARMAS